ncbi:hypothetical protein ACFL21_01495 [Patescibacteria group bacterium]
MELKGIFYIVLYLIWHYWYVPVIIFFALLWLPGFFDWLERIEKIEDEDDEGDDEDFDEVENDEDFDEDIDDIIDKQ